MNYTTQNTYYVNTETSTTLRIADDDAEIVKYHHPGEYTISGGLGNNVSLTLDANEVIWDTDLPPTDEWTVTLTEGDVDEEWLKTVWNETQLFQELSDLEKKVRDSKEILPSTRSELESFLFEGDEADR